MYAVDSTGVALDVFQAARDLNRVARHAEHAARAAERDPKFAEVARRSALKRDDLGRFVPRGHRHATR